MFCVNCGHQNPDGSNFCNSCGYSFISKKSVIINGPVSSVNVNRGIVCSQDDYNAGRGVVFAALQNLGSTKVYAYENSLKRYFSTIEVIHKHFKGTRLRVEYKDFRDQFTRIEQDIDRIKQITSFEKIHAKYIVDIAVYNLDWNFDRPACRPTGELMDSVIWYTGCIYDEKPRFGKVMGGIVSDTVLQVTIFSGHDKVQKNAHAAMENPYYVDCIEPYAGSVKDILWQIGGEINCYSRLIAKAVLNLENCTKILEELKDIPKEQGISEESIQLIENTFILVAYMDKLLNMHLLNDKGFLSDDVRNILKDNI